MTFETNNPSKDSFVGVFCHTRKVTETLVLTWYKSEYYIGGSLFFFHRVLVCSLTWPSGSEPPASALRALGPQTCATMPTHDITSTGTLLATTKHETASRKTSKAGNRQTIISGILLLFGGFCFFFLSLGLTVEISLVGTLYVRQAGVELIEFSIPSFTQCSF